MQLLQPNQLDYREAKKLIDAEKVVRVTDSYPEQLKELFLIRNPQFRFSTDYEQQLQFFIGEHTQNRPLIECGNWFYFEWSKVLVHLLPEELYLELRTARNRYLITDDEQQIFYNCKVGIAGLSVGSHAALTLVMMGGVKVIKLADPDVVSASNLNRLRYGVPVLGENKAVVAARQIAEINPYSKIFAYGEGLNANNIDDFFILPNNSKIDVLVEETDNLEMKILLREKAKQLQIPVVMGTDNGDGVIIDIERYDKEPNLKIFNGALGDFSYEDFKKYSPADLPRLATQIAGQDLIVTRMLQSLAEVGKTLYSWPQLGSAATFSGVVVAYLVRKISIGENIKSGKYDLNLEAIFDENYNAPQAKTVRQNRKEQFLKLLNLKT